MFELIQWIVTQNRKIIATGHVRNSLTYGVSLNNSFSCGMEIYIKYNYNAKSIINLKLKYIIEFIIKII